MTGLLQSCEVVSTLSYFTLLSFISIHSSSSICPRPLCSSDAQQLIGIVALRVYAIYRGKRWVRRVLCVAGILYALSTLIIATVTAIADLSQLFDIRFLFVSLNLCSPEDHAQAGRQCHTKVRVLSSVDNTLFPTASSTDRRGGRCGYRRSYSVLQHFGEDSRSHDLGSSSKFFSSF
jgi:hypothetical protein